MWCCEERRTSLIKPFHLALAAIPLSSVPVRKYLQCTYRSTKYVPMYSHSSVKTGSSTPAIDGVLGLLSRIFRSHLCNIRCYHSMFEQPDSTRRCISYPKLTKVCSPRTPKQEIKTSIIHSLRTQISSWVSTIYK